MPRSETWPKRVAFDCDLCRPGCAIIQAALGGSIGIANEFPGESWLINMTPGMKVYPVKDAEFLEFLKRKVRSGMASDCRGL